MLKKHNKLSWVAAVCMLLGNGASEGAVTLTFAQSGMNVTATWSGTYVLPEEMLTVGRPRLVS